MRERLMSLGLIMLLAATLVYVAEQREGPLTTEARLALYAAVWHDVRKDLMDDLTKYGIDTIIYGPVTLRGPICRISHVLLWSDNPMHPAVVFVGEHEAVSIRAFSVRHVGDGAYIEVRDGFFTTGPETPAFLEAPGGYVVPNAASSIESPRAAGSALWPTLRTE
jgi:hypothetical protein